MNFEYLMLVSILSLVSIMLLCLVSNRLIAQSMRLSSSSRILRSVSRSITSRRFHPMAIPSSIQQTFRFAATASFLMAPASSALFSSAASTTGTSLGASSTVEIDSQPAAEPVQFFRSDYAPSPFSIPTIKLNFELSMDNTKVVTTSTIFRQDNSLGSDLVLDGEDITLESVSINGVPLVAGESYVKTATHLRIKSAALPATNEFQLETTVTLHPDKNLALSGLYKSSAILCTQCEAMGFRRITYHLDRPDVLTRYQVRLEAQKSDFPILLSNGNNIDGGELSNGRHWALWEDPFPKPSYLFALVAGDLASISSEYTTTSGRVVKLGIYSDKENAHKLDHAMYSIKESMKWDEDTFGLECDLDVYNIVATNDFNMGAMENKGLNIFNAAYVLADPKTATDDDYERILGVIAHEYFHNWSGNRVTVRDWFQLTLKEGLTVFRDQWFSSDATSDAVKRIEDVRMLRSRQFAEDQGPMSHPIRPESYISMDNFYTATVYVKGAEVVRLYRTILGDAGFKKGLKLYFDRHDGMAVTCDDFRAAMADANEVDLSQLELWYSQAGTPVVEVTHYSYSEEEKKVTLRLKQSCPDTPGQKEADKRPMWIPVAVGFIGKTSGQELLKPSATQLLKLSEAEQTFTFDNINEEPVMSLLRDFSAPVKLRLEQSDSELASLMAFDSDSFNKWDAGNRLSSKIILDLARLIGVSEIQSTTLPRHYIDAVREVLASCSSMTSEEKIDHALISYALQLPDTLTLSQEMSVINPTTLHAARQHVKRQLAVALRSELEAVYSSISGTAAAAGAAAGGPQEYVFSPAEVGRRRLRATCLDFLSQIKEDPQAIRRAKAQFDSANCMTDKLAALACLVSKVAPERDQALATFHRDAQGDALVLNKWFAIQASADVPDLLERVKALKGHPDFIISNPNRARSLISMFAGNMVHFHAEDGAGYKFIADCIVELDALNPQVAARLASAFSPWKRYDAHRQELMKAELKRIEGSAGLSKDTFEVVSRCLK